MKAAEEILNDYLQGGQRFSEWLKPLIIKAINEARKAVIEECAERAEVEIYGDGAGEINKQSILSLINELK